MPNRRSESRPWQFYPTHIVSSLCLICFVLNGCQEEEIPSFPEITVSAIWTSGIEISWAAPGDELRIQLSEDNSFQNIYADTTSVEEYIVIEGLASATEYYLRAQITDTNGISEFSDPIPFLTEGLLNPRNVQIDNTLSNQIHLSWEGDFGAEYEVHVSATQNFSSFEVFTPIPPRNPRIILGPLERETEYYVRLRSKNLDKTSGWVLLDPIRTIFFSGFHLGSRDFNPGQIIPDDYSCDGTSPNLYWPSFTSSSPQSFAVEMTDNLLQTHWILYNIPPDITELPRGSTGDFRPESSTEIVNDFGIVGYSGPCPPVGAIRQYTFTVMALPFLFNPDSTQTVESFKNQIEDLSLTRGILFGLY